MRSPSVAIARGRGLMTACDACGGMRPCRACRAMARSLRGSGLGMTTMQKPGSGSVDDTERHGAFMSALVTEHFVLQTGADAATTEMGSRAALYLSVLGSALVVMGFAAQSRAVF